MNMDFVNQIIAKLSRAQRGTFNHYALLFGALFSIFLVVFTFIVPYLPPGMSYLSDSIWILSFSLAAIAFLLIKRTPFEGIGAKVEDLAVIALVGLVIVIIGGQFLLQLFNGPTASANTQIYLTSRELREFSENQGLSNRQREELQKILDNQGYITVNQLFDSPEFDREVISLFESYVESRGFVTRSMLTADAATAVFNLIATAEALPPCLILIDNYSNIAVRRLPELDSEELGYLYNGSRVVVIGRSEDSINSNDLWWLVDLQARANDISTWNPVSGRETTRRGWVSNAVVSISSDTRCSQVDRISGTQR